MVKNICKIVFLLVLKNFRNKSCTCEVKSLNFRVRE